MSLASAFSGASSAHGESRTNLRRCSFGEPPKPGQCLELAALLDHGKSPHPPQGDRITASHAIVALKQAAAPPLRQSYSSGSRGIKGHTAMAKQFGDRWEVARALEEGGQAWTYTVRDTRGSRDTLYVLKRLKNPARAARFRNEVEAIRNLSDAHVVRLVDFDVDAKEPFLVTEYCEGGALSSSPRYWATSPAETMGIFLQIANGVAAAHAAGIVHRDLKPENVFLRTSRGPAVVGDFGICLLNASNERHTATDEAVGPRLYMAPELEDGRLEAVSPSVDIYSLGKLLYWLFTGRVFSREKHRQPGWNLTESAVDPFAGPGYILLEHVSALLDHMIVLDANARRDIGNIIILAQQTQHLLLRERHPLLNSGRHWCEFCGRGYYQLRAQGDPIAVSNFGFTPVGNAKWFVYTCSICGHVQAFRRDLSDPQKGWPS